jgi:adenylate kinase
VSSTLVLIGPPGSGKSTIATELARSVNLTTIATGKRLRDEIASGSPIGREIGPLLEKGHFAPDSLMDRLMREWLAQVPPATLVLLDGYPRSTRQALALESMLADLGRPLRLVVALEVDDTTLVHRLSGRRICEGGGETFTLHIDDQAAVARCAASGGRLVQREDDQPAVISERLAVYARETEPLITFYGQNGLLQAVDAQGTPAEVAARVRDLLV